MEYLFDVEMLESCFGGKNTVGFNYDEYAKCMIEEDKKMDEFIKSGCSLPSDLTVNNNPKSNQSKETLISEICSDASDEELGPDGEDDDDGSESSSPEYCNGDSTEHKG